MRNYFLKLVVLCFLAILLIQCGGKKVVRFDPVEGNITGCDLSASVKIVRDAQGVPHIMAETDEDLFYALGYAMAQDRFTDDRDGQPLLAQSRS